MLYGCETWSFILREEGRLRVFENRILRQICEPKRDWRRCDSKKHNTLYCSSNIFRVNKYRRLRWAGHLTRMEDGRSGIKIFLLVNLQERDLQEGLDGDRTISE